MALSAGTKLGPYEIVSPLGAGGMGEVYRAKDTRLDRTVAVKILPEHLAANSEARQRFEREARSISALNHPNICVLHDIGTQNGTSYLVMEFVEGETLEERLQKGPLPLKQALTYGVQICEALEKAHRAGIVHRDLKPGNIMLTSAGAKLLDFGLAKPFLAIAGTSPKSSTDLQMTSDAALNLTALTAKASPLTQQGSVVGTFQFMAPEVLQGKEADARSDIFSLGCVLYEMISGRRAFQGKSQLSVMTAILESEPEPLSKLQPLSPPALDHVVETCLVKEPDARWQNAADVGRELRWVADSGLSATATAPAEKRNWPERWLWAVAVVALLGALLWLGMREHPSLPSIRAYLPPPPDTGFDFTGDFSGAPALSADGTMVAFCARNPKQRSFLWVQPLNELSARKLEGTDGAAFPFWSPDGKFLGFFADGHLKKVPAAGGPVIVLADAPNARGGSWNQDNIILFEPEYRNSLWQITANGGTPTIVTKLESGKHTTHRWPEFLPDGKHFLFFATSHSGGTEQGVYYGSLKDGSFKHVVESDSDGVYAAGYLLYHRQSQLMAQRFDPGNGNVSGDPQPVVSFVEYDPGTWHATFTASDNGLMLYEPGTKTRGVQLEWMNRSGKTLGEVTNEGGFKGSGRISSDGKRLVTAEGDPQGDVWVIDLATGSRTRLTFGGATHLMPSWSADGKRVVYVKQSGPTLITGTSICARQASGGGQEQVLMDSGPPGAKTLLSPQFSPDGKYLLYMQQSGPTNAEIWALPLTADGKPFPLVKPSGPQARIVQYRLSPDGRWLAYTSTESGREEVYVTHFPSGEGRWQVSQTAGTFPTWRGDSKEIYFVGLSDANFRAAPVNPKSEEFQVGQAQPLFTVNFTAPLGVPYDPAPDGQRFIFATYPETVSNPLVVVTNWTGELKK
jgi:serine/threonine protein kinase/Tol biopolymer transport system component